MMGELALRASSPIISMSVSAPGHEYSLFCWKTRERQFTHQLYEWAGARPEIILLENA